MTPSPPVFPTNISPSVQYGNEHQDDGSNEKRTPKKPIISVQPVTDIYDDRFLTQTFAIFYNREATESTESTETSEKPKSKEQSAPSFTSGHQNSFGIPIEEAERMKSTTQAAIYNTKVSPTLPSVTGNNRVRSTTVRSRWNTTEDGKYMWTFRNSKLHMYLNFFDFRHLSFNSFVNVSRCSAVRFDNITIGHRNK